MLARLYIRVPLQRRALQTFLEENKVFGGTSPLMHKEQSTAAVIKRVTASAREVRDNLKQ